MTILTTIITVILLGLIGYAFNYIPMQPTIKKWAVGLVIFIAVVVVVAFGIDFLGLHKYL